eukprot:gene2957-3407_t
MSSSGEQPLSKDEVAFMRINYSSKGLHWEELEKVEPITMFDTWFKLAKDCVDIVEANSMSLATVSSDCKPSVRIVLMKGYDRNGFRFFTNYESRKGKEMEQNPNVAILFYWEPLQRQVRVEGKVEKLPNEVSTEYFHSRPRNSQLGALASRQSEVIPNKEFVSNKFHELKNEYEGKDIPKPDCWGGYILKPELFEFWAGGKGRMHDRIVFRRPSHGDDLLNDTLTKQGADGWLYEFLSP